MTPESIVVGLEQAKQLKEAGYPQQAEFFYQTFKDEIPATELIWDKRHAWDWNDQFIAAPSAEEILRRLPDRIRSSDIIPSNTRAGQPARLFADRFPSWAVGYGRRRELLYMTGDSLANAAAAMWIYLKEHDLLPPAP